MKFVTGKIAKMEETVKIMDFILKTLFENHLAKRIEDGFMNRDQANDEYTQIYEINKLLIAANKKGHTCLTLKNLVEAMPIADRTEDNASKYTQTYNFIRIMKLAESRGISLPQLRTMILANKKKPYQAGTLF